MQAKLLNRLSVAVFFMTCVLSVPACAQVQDWPIRPVKFIVPFPAGGSLDPIARLAAAKLQESLNQPFIVENRPGASGIIGTAAAVKAPPDGYTFLFVFDTHAVNPALLPNLPYNTLRDLSPVMLVGKAPMAIVTRADRPYKMFSDVIEAAKIKPRSVSYGTMNGTLGHLTMTLLEQSAGIQLLTVPYKGGAPMMQDAIGGQIDLAIGSPATVLPHVGNGKMRVLAVTGDKRSEMLPDIPTLAEQGFNAFSAYAWWAIFAPAGTPEWILKKLHAELAKAFALPDARKILTHSLGMDVLATSPEALDGWLLAEMHRWGKVVKDNNIKAE